jgi:acyl carrier protein
MESEIRSYVLEVITKVMNIEVDVAVDDNMPIGPAGIDLDSLSFMELIANVEKKYGIKVPDDDMETLSNGTLGMVVAYIAQHRLRVA